MSAKTYENQTPLAQVTDKMSGIFLERRYKQRQLQLDTIYNITQMSGTTTACYASTKLLLIY